MFVFREERLEESDIILIASRTARGKAVKVGTASRYSHAMLYLGGHSVIDSTGSGVHTNNIHRIGFKRDSDVLVLRHNPPLDAQTRERISNYARSRVAQRYSIPEAIQAARGKKGQPSSAKQFCSRLVAQAYASVGIDLVADPNFCLPKDFAAASGLFAVADVSMNATAGHLEALKGGEDDFPAQQTKITNRLMQSVRQRTGHDVGTFDDINRLVLDHPEVDSAVNNSIVESGYTEMWKRFAQTYPAFYSIPDFKRVFPQDRWKSIAANQLVEEKNMKDRFMNVLIQYQTMNHRSRRATFDTMIELYSNLVEQSMRRTAVLKTIVRAK